MLLYKQMSQTGIEVPRAGRRSGFGDRSASGGILRRIFINNSCVAAVVQVNLGQLRAKYAHGQGTFPPHPTCPRRKFSQKGCH